MRVLLLATLTFAAPQAFAQSSEESLQPYIDRLKATDPGIETGTSEQASEANPEVYIKTLREKVRKRDAHSQIGEAPENQSYTEFLRGKLGGPEPEVDPAAESYSEHQKRLLLERDQRTGAVDDSAITKVKEGRSDLELRRPGNINFAGGMRLGASMSRTVTASAGNALRDFSDVYGTNWAPELHLFFEYQPFHSEWFGNIGIILGGGVTRNTGKGKFPAQVPRSPDAGGGSFEADTNVDFQFLTLPAYIGVNYRFNLFRIVRPYVQFTPTLIGYREGRNDTNTARAGISKGAIASGGINILLDWVSERSSWDLYDSVGVKHYYLTIDYSRMMSFASAISFTYSGVSAGMTMEF